VVQALELSTSLINSSYYYRVPECPKYIEGNLSKAGTISRYNYKAGYYQVIATLRKLFEAGTTIPYTRRSPRQTARLWRSSSLSQKHGTADILIYTS
jgi:hypothetical protein